MKNSKIFGIGLAAALFLAAIPATSYAATGGDFWVSDITNQPPKQTLRVVWKDAVTDGVFFSTDPRNAANSESNRTQISHGFKTVLGLCGEKAETGCISTVEFKLEDGWHKAVSKPSPGQRNFAFGTIAKDMTWDNAKSSIYASDPSAGIFAASEPNLFAFPGAANRLGDNYWVNAVVNSYMDGSKAKMSGLDISAWGVAIGSSCPDADRIEGDLGSYCNTLVNIPKDLEIRVSVYFGNRISELSGWFDGRMILPNIDFGVEKPGYVTVSGSPVEVSTAATSFIPKGDPLYDVSPEVETMQHESGEPRQAIGRFDGISNWTKYSPKILDKAASTNTYWRLSSWVSNEQARYSCSSVPGVQGVILTNAAAYTPNAPRWNQAQGTLDFEVASTHFKANGDLNDGFYDLLLNEKIAKCIWGSAATGSKATISVVNADGSSQTATTTYVLSNGWAKFKAYGYHYSAPTIKVNLANARAVVAPAKKTTITCVSVKNKKLTKKVTSVSPKCPTGYKKKA